MDLLHPVVLHTMRWSAEFAIPCVAPSTGATLRLLAQATQAHAVVEVGTGLGVSGLWLLDGLGPSGLLTTIDGDADLHGMARQAYAAAGHSPSRYRLLTGRAEVMLGRLTDAAYDLLFVDIDEQRTVWTEAAARLLRPGGLLVVHEPDDEDRDRLVTPQWTSAELGTALLAAIRNQG
jgi:predicted O-methyltransferase YrrM